MTAKRVRIKPILLTVSILILMFQLNISSVFPAINYYDEIFAILGIVFYVSSKKGKLGKQDLQYFLMILIIFVIGCIGNMRTHINEKAFIMLVDGLGTVKVFMTLYAVKGIFTKNDCDQSIKYLANVLQVYVFIAGICYVLGIALNWSWMFKQARFGFMTYGFVHGYAGDGWLGYYLEACYCVFAMRGKKLRFATFTKILCLLLAVLTFKGPALLFVAFVILYKMITSGKVKTYHIVLTVIVGIVVGWWHIQRYLLTEGEARAILNATGFKIAKDYFPTGMGFATFGSDLSRDFYSAAYSMYGINTIYGLGGFDSVAYITDNYWAMLLGQLGFISTALFIFFYFRMFKEINNKKNILKDTRMAFLAMFFSFMAGSIGSAYLTSHLGVMCFALFGLFLCPRWGNNYESTAQIVQKGD